MAPAKNFLGKFPWKSPNRFYKKKPEINQAGYIFWGKGYAVGEGAVGWLTRPWSTTSFCQPNDDYHRAHDWLLRLMGDIGLLPGEEKNWLVVSTHLKNISQIGTGVRIKNIWNHHLEKGLRWSFMGFPLWWKVFFHEWQCTGSTVLLTWVAKILFKKKWWQKQIQRESRKQFCPETVIMAEDPKAIAVGEKSMEKLTFQNQNRKKQLKKSRSLLQCPFRQQLIRAFLRKAESSRENRHFLLRCAFRWNPHFYRKKLRTWLSRQP